MDTSSGGNLYVALSDVIRSRDDGGRLRTSLEALHKEIKVAGSALLGAAYDSLSLPLTLIVRSSAFLKKNPAAKVQVPAAGNDRVVETAVQCMMVIFQQGITADRGIDVIYPFADLLTLKKDNSSEELRELSLRCLCALLENWSGSGNCVEHNTEGPNSMDAIRFIVYRCVTYVGEEGPRGNRHIVANAYKSVKLLAKRFPSPKLWMPILPGCIAELSKTLLTAGSGINMSGPSLPPSTVVVEALDALVALVETVLHDNIVKKVKPLSQQNPADTLDAIINGLKTNTESNASTNKGTECEINDSPSPSTSTPSPNGSWQWCAFTAKKLEESFNKCLPNLQHHPALSVRQKLGEGVVALLSSCLVALEASHDTLTRVILALAHDDWDKVSSPCRNFLNALSNKLSSSTGANSQEDHPLANIIERIIKQRSGDLHKAMHDGDGVAAARQLTSAMEIAGPLRVHQLLIGSPIRLSTFCASIIQCFAFDPSAAPMLLKSSAEPGPHLQTPTHLAPKSGDTSTSAAQEASTQQQDDEIPVNSAADLPRMPVGLNVMNESLYKEFAAVARTLGWMVCHQVEEPGGLHDVIDALEDVVRRSNQDGIHPLDAASAVAVISEVLFGTCTIAGVSLGLKRPHVASTDTHSASFSRMVQMVVLNVLDTYASMPLWSVKTYNADSASGDTLSTEVLGQNAVLVRTLLDSVGTFARVVGKPFAEGGQMLRLALMPMLERLGDPCPLVQAAAETAVNSVCWHCGYGSLEHLVSANGDYIVDGLCSQLRQIHLYPHAPHLFAALLRRARVAPKLLPLLAEPAALSLKGVAIISRASTNGHTPPFLQAMLEIVTCAEKESKNLLKESEAHAEVLNARVQEAEWKRSRRGTVDDLEMFLNEPEDEFDAEKTILLDPQQEEELEARMRRTHSVSMLASSVAELAGPLMVVKDTRVCLLALSVCSMALRSLKSSSRCHSIDDEIREDYLSKHRLASTPVPPKPEMVLPMVHILWTPLKSALEDTRIAVMEGAMDGLASVTESGGSRFLGRRFKTDIWPIFDRIITGEGCGRRRANLRLLEEEVAPNTIMRSKLSVMKCVARIAQDEETRGVFKAIIRPLAELLVPLLGKSQALPIREEASKAIKSLAKVDADVVWFVLTDVIAAGAHVSQQLWTSSHSHMLPHQKEVLPKVGWEGGAFARGRNQNVGELNQPYFLTKELAADCGERAAALLEKVETESVEWHAKTMELLK